MDHDRINNMNPQKDINITNEAVRLGFWGLSPDELIKTITLDIDEEYHKEVSKLIQHKEKAQSIIDRYKQKIEVLRNKYDDDKLSPALLAAGFGFFILCAGLCYISNWLLAPGGIALITLTVLGAIMMRFQSFEDKIWRYISLGFVSILSFLIVLSGMDGYQFNNVFAVVCGITTGILVFVINISFSKEVISDVFGTMTKIWIVIRNYWNERVLEFWLRRHKHFQTKLFSTEAKKNVLADKARAVIMNEYNLGKSMNTETKELNTEIMMLPIKNGEMKHVQ